MHQEHHCLTINLHTTLFYLKSSVENNITCSGADTKVKMPMQWQKKARNSIALLKENKIGTDEE